MIIIADREAFTESEKFGKVLKLNIVLSLGVGRLAQVVRARH